MADNILLIGFMGVGKGRTARALAAKTGCFAVDTDDLIESFVKLKIRTLFDQQGEPAFRKIEQQVGCWLEANVQGTIVSTGGGFFMVENLNRIGKVVYLHSSLKAIISTLKKHPNAARKVKKRPLLQDMEKAKVLYQARLPQYREVADYEVNVEGRKTSDIATEIKSLLARDRVLSL
ncbi:MAG: shikimate kinase [Desulfobulbus sp.]